jgi:hypothetical protein
MPKVAKKILLQWDTLAIIEAEVAFLQETDKQTDKQELFNQASSDSDLFEREYEDLTDFLTECMRRNVHHGWFSSVKNFGWDHRSGHKTFTAVTGKELIKAVLPDCDCTYRIYRYGNGFAINNAHHDSPTWNEWYYISPCRESDWEKRITQYQKDIA